MKNYKILLIEDDLEDVDLFKEQLSQANGFRYNVQHLDSIKACKELKEDETFDIIFSDLGLPDSQGDETLNHILELFSSFPIVILTGNDDERLTKLALEGGIQDYLIKGEFNEGQLQKTIKFAINRKKNNLELISAKEKAEQSDRLKSAFLANMSHEIRTPMNGILGFIDIMSDPNLIDHKNYDEFFSIIKKSGNRLLNTINDIIEISRIESGGTVYKESEFDLIDFLKYYHQFFKSQAEDKGIELKFHPKLVKLPIKTDKTKLDSLVTNLLKNAIKFTIDGYIEFGFVLKDNLIQFYVKDTGVGISPEGQKIVFKRFTQEVNQKNKGIEGSGLGLAICKSYANLLGGDIWLESEIDKGSTFYFTIKKNNGQPVHSIPLEKKDKKITGINNKLNILVVEDDEASYQYLRALLAGNEYSVTHANNGRKAFEEFCNNDFDLVLMDIRMPEMDGYETTKKIRTINKKIPIIAQTAYAFSGDQEKAIQAGCDAYLSKPLNKDLLLKKIQILVK